MKKTIGIIVSLVVLIPVLVTADPPPEIHCKHFFWGYPTGTPETNDLIIRDIYALSSNDTTKFADWVAYRLDYRTVSGEEPRRRGGWETDPWLEDNETLEFIPDDYKDASKDRELKIERGHQAPVASFEGNINWRDANYYSNMTPQKKNLNRGPWRSIEESVRELVRADNVAYVMTGPLYEYGEGETIPQLPEADESHTVPSGYWKIVAIQPTKNTNSVMVAGFIFEQNTPRDADVLDYLVTVDEIEERSRLDFMWELVDNVEDYIEGKLFDTWAGAWVE